ncbi:hypothetical protein BHE74_00012040 [Ensete ventricosum]|nr:hypothetical protein BHE74_00012040 [Ensete ventricosum]
MVFWEGWISDELMGTFSPIVVYWLYAGTYQLLPPLDQYRLHTRKEEEQKNSVPLSSVIKGVLLQQLVQATVAGLMFLVSSSKSLRCDFQFSINLVLDHVKIRCRIKLKDLIIILLIVAMLRKVEFRWVFRAPSLNFKILAIPNVLAHEKSYEHGFTKKCNNHKLCAKSHAKSHFDRFFVHRLVISKYWPLPAY